MFSFMNFARTLLSKLLAFLCTFLSVLLGGFGFQKDLPVCPDDFTPVLRFVVCSDAHLNGEEDQEEVKRLERLFDTAYGYCEKQTYKNLDAVVCVGDMATRGRPQEYDMLNRILSEKVREGTQVLYSMGNHEYINYRDTDASLAVRLFEEKMQREDKEHTVINGYHFIISSYDENGDTYKEKGKWIDAQIKEAIKDTGDKPVFVFQHPAPFGTIYGSVHWGDITMAGLLVKYPQVIDFSGHSHYPVNDPRSVWQGGYTAIGCGTLSYFETELDGIAGNFPYETEKAAQFHFVEVDKDGNVRVMPYDLMTDSFFSNEYYFTDLVKRNYPYSFLKMELRDRKPYFPKDTQIGTHKNSEGETILTFTGAKDKYIVESYKLSVSKGVIPVFEDNFSSKYMYLFEDDVYEINLGKLESGKKYHVQIVALNAYAMTSCPLDYTFKAE